jgi:hypothetical protein
LTHSLHSSQNFPLVINFFIMKAVFDPRIRKNTDAQ